MQAGLVQLPRTFDKVMGIAIKDDQIALACREEVIKFTDSKKLAAHYPKKPNTYDALYMPRATYFTGQVDLHDLEFGRQGSLFAVNTSFSCLVQINDQYSFTPYWQPPFIDQLVSEDRCHLNGMAMLEGMPKYATAFNTGNTAQSWRTDILSTGILIDVRTDEVLLEGLSMPHSPRVRDGDLFLLLSGTGQLIKVDPLAGTYEEVVKIDGFVRGLAIQGNHAFIGVSRLRENSTTFAKLDIARKAEFPGIVVVELSTGNVVGEIRYHSSVEEIYDVSILTDTIRPNILNTRNPEYRFGLTTPNSSYWASTNQSNAKK